MRYTVTLTETTDYEVEVEAASEDEAAERAEALFTEKGCTEFPCTVHERDATEIKPICRQHRDDGRGRCIDCGEFL